MATNDQVKSTENHASQSSTQGGADVVLLEVEPAVAVLVERPDGGPVGKAGQQDWSVESFGIGRDSARRIAEALDATLGQAGLAAPGATTQGLVRLAPETVARLGAMPARAQGGGSQGALSQVGPQSSAAQASADAPQVCWLPVASEQGAELLQALGRALPLLRISAQLAFLSQGLEEGTGLVRAALEALYAERWPTISGMRTTILDVIAESREAGRVRTRPTSTSIIWPESMLSDELTYFGRRTYRHDQHLDAHVPGRWEYLRDNLEQVVADYQGLLVIYTINCGELMLKDGEHASNPNRSASLSKSMARRSVNISAGHREVLDRAARVLAMIDAQRHLCTEVTGRAWPPSTPGLTSSAVDLDATVQATARYVDRLRGTSQAEPLAVAPAIQLVRREVPERVLAALRWLLPAEEPLIALAEVDRSSLAGALQGLGTGPAQGVEAGVTTYLGITSTRFFLASEPALVEDGRLELSLLLADVRYVRLRMVGSGAVMNVIMKDEDLSIGFEEWAVSTAFGTGLAHRLSDLLMTKAGIPEEEQRSDPLFAIMTSRERR